jgi:acyl carrier protein
MTDRLGAIEDVLAEIWAAELDQPVGREDDFFGLGGDSIMVLRILYELRDRLGVEVAPSSFFEHPTVAALAELVIASP